MPMSLHLSLGACDWNSHYPNISCRRANRIIDAGCTEGRLFPATFLSIWLSDLPQTAGVSA